MHNRRKLEDATGYDLGEVSAQEEQALLTEGAVEADAHVGTSFGGLSMSVKTAVARLPGSPVMLVTIMRDVTERRALEESLRPRLQELEATRERVRQLQELLPICMHCNRIRAADGRWEKIESYMSATSNTSFTHTLCAVCLEEHYPS